MKNIINLLIIICSIGNLNSQSQNEVYAILDDSSLFRLNKKKNQAFLKIPYYKYKNTWLKVKPATNGNDIIKIQTKSISYEFYSVEKPKRINSIENIKTFSVTDVSKENKNVWQKYPYYINFIEKISCNDYTVWKMKPVFKE